MKVSSKRKVAYKKLWKMLIDKDMTCADLRAKTGISGSTFAKMTRGEDVTVNILTRICEPMQCGIGDIMEIIPVNAVHGHNV